MGPLPPETRLSAYLRHQLAGEHATKRLANVINGTPKAAEHILAGKWPCYRHMRAIVQRFGRDALEATFGDDIDATTARLREELRRHEQQAADLRLRLVQAQGGRTGGAAGLGANDDRTAVKAAD